MHRTLSAAGAFWLAAFTYFIWGFTFLASRIAQDYGTPFVLLFWRFALAFLLLNLLRLTGRFPVRFRSRKLWPVLLAGLFEPVLYFPCEQYGLRLTSTSFSGVMVALIPLCSLVYGAIFLHEKATWRQVVFSVLSVAGVIVLAVYATGIGAGSFLGFLILLGIGPDDTPALCRKLAEKILGLRVFRDENDKMNRSLADVGGSVLVVSQFTLYGDVSHGRRPSFIGAAKPDLAIPLYEQFLAECERLGFPPQHGEFGAYMQVSSENDGPVTLIVDTDDLK